MLHWSHWITLNRTVNSSSSSMYSLFSYCFPTRMTQILYTLCYFKPKFYFHKDSLCIYHAVCCAVNFFKSLIVFQLTPMMIGIAKSVTHHHFHVRDVKFLCSPLEGNSHRLGKVLVEMFKNNNKNRKKPTQGNLKNITKGVQKTVV